MIEADQVTLDVFLDKLAMDLTVSSNISTLCWISEKMARCRGKS
jgi:hypothetical protein